MTRRLFALTLGLVLISWSAFAAGLLGQLAPRYRDVAASPSVWLSHALVPALGPAALIALFAFGWRARSAWWPPLARALAAHARALDAVPAAQLGAWVALAAAAGIFGELMMIRIHASCFQVFAYFKNVSLLSCFLGLGLGYARSERGHLMTPIVLPALALQIAVLHSLRLFGVGEFLRNPIA